MPASPRHVASTITPELSAVLESIRELAKGAAGDAREARDGVNRLESRFSAENTQAQISELWATIKGNDQAHRSDLINTSDRLSARIKFLEDDKVERDAARGWRGTVGRNMPWIVAIAALALSVYGGIHHG